MIFTWKQPVEWCHSGIPQGNGLFGSLIWGDKQNIKITLNRSDYWFYGDNLPPGKEQSYENLKKYLRDGNEPEVQRIFAGVTEEKRPLKSTRLPMGRLDIQLPESRDAELSLNTVTSEGKIETASGSLTVKSILPRTLPLLALSISGKDYKKCAFVSKPADAEEIKEFYAENAFPPLRIFDNENKSGGWLQEVPGAKTLCLQWEVVEKENSLELFLCAGLCETPSESESYCRKVLAEATAKGFDSIAAETSSWWGKYWDRVPEIKTPDTEINELYTLGMYRLAGLCSPDAPPATLQGPWCEEHKMPPWSCDYHFNINVEECYWPVFAGNVPEFIMPLFKMLESWEPVLKEYAENFVGISDGLMLPHAVDDKGIALGGFWAGHVDHACTAWTAQLMYLYWKYTLDEEFMTNTLYPFMLGSMNVYEAMLEEDEDGNLFIAAQVSPEYNGSNIDAWGRNPSIHLAAVHFLADSLLEISEKLDRDRDRRQRWQEINSKLPIASVSPEGEICIWDGQPLDLPHRHFSHLSSIHPFDLLDWRNSEEHASLVAKTIYRWVEEGTGRWAGWSFPWASIICSRLEMPEVAHTMLSMFRRAFMKDDYALRYLPDNMSFTAIPGCAPDHLLIMQIEAGMAAAAAVMEMCVHCSRDIIYPFAGIPACWRDLSFESIRTSGAFILGGKKEDARITELTVRSEKGGILQIALPDTLRKVRRNGKTEEVKEKVYRISMDAGETITFTI